MKKLFLFFSGLVWISTFIVKGGAPEKVYRGYVDFAFGDAYNLDTSQIVGIQNMQLYSAVSTTHGLSFKNWFWGCGIGFYHSFRDREKVCSVFAAGRYVFGSDRMNPFIETRAGIVYDHLWVEKVQKYAALSGGMEVYKKLQVGLRFSIFSRPSRYFTTNAAVVLTYAFGE